MKLFNDKERLYGTANPFKIPETFLAGYLPERMVLCIAECHLISWLQAGRTKNYQSWPQ